MFNCIELRSRGAPGEVAHAFNPRTWEAEAGGFQCSMPAWSTECVPGLPGVFRETLSQKTIKKKKNVEGQGPQLQSWQAAI